MKKLLFILLAMMISINGWSQCKNATISLEEYDVGKTSISIYVPSNYKKVIVHYKEKAATDFLVDTLETEDNLHFASVSLGKLNSLTTYSIKIKGICFLQDEITEESNNEFSSLIDITTKGPCEGSPDSPVISNVTSTSITWKMTQDPAIKEYICIIYNEGIPLDTIKTTLPICVYNKGKQGNPYMMKYQAVCMDESISMESYPSENASLLCLGESAPHVIDFNQIEQYSSLNKNCFAVFSDINGNYKEYPTAQATNWMGNTRHPFRYSLLMGGDKELITTSNVNILAVKGVDFDFSVAIEDGVDETTWMPKYSLTESIASDYKFEVLVSQDDFVTYETIKTLTGDELLKTNGHVVLDLSKFQSKNNGVIRLGFYPQPTDDRKIFIDNVNFRTYSGCPEVYAVYTNLRTSNSVEITWDTIGATEYGYNYGFYPGPKEEFIPSQIESENIKSPYVPVELNGLVEGEVYTIGVQHACGGQWIKYELRVPQSIVELPYETTFEEDKDLLYWQFANKEGANAWTINDAVNNTPNGRHALYISNNNANVGMQGGKCTFSLAYIDVMFGNADNYLLQFDWKNSNSVDNSFGVAIGDPAETPFVWNEEGQPYSYDYPSWLDNNGNPNISGNRQYFKQNDGMGGMDFPNYVLNGWFGFGQSDPPKWRQAQIVLDNKYNGKIQRVYFVWRNTPEVTKDVAQIDNFILKELICPKAIAESVSDIDYKNAKFTFSVDPSSDILPVEYEIGVLDVKADKWVYSTTTTSPFNIEELSPSTLYKVIVRSKCSGNEYGIWSDTIKFQTMCAPYGVPYTENFPFVVKGDHSANKDYYTCWEYMTGPFGVQPEEEKSNDFAEVWDYDYVMEENYNVVPPVEERSNFVYGAFYNYNKKKWLVTPEFHIGNETNKYMLKTRLKYTSDYDRSVSSGVFDNSKDTFAIIFSYDAGNTWDFANAIVYDNTGSSTSRVLNDLDYTWQNIFIPLNVPQGSKDTTVRIAYYLSGPSNNDYTNYNICIKEVEIVDYSNCTPPIGVIASDITANSAKITWTKAKEEDNSFKVFYRPIGKSNYSEMIVSQTTALLTKLEQGVSYEVRVATNCVNEKPLDSSNIVRFVTSCSFSIPWKDGFEEGDLCWKSAWAKNYQGAWKSSEGGAKYGRYKLLSSMSQIKDTNIIVSPTLDLSGAERVILAFWKQQTATFEDPNVTADFKLLVRTYNPDPSSVAKGWTELATMTDINKEYKYLRFLIPDSLYKSTFQFAFQLIPSSLGLASDVLIDDIEVFDAPKGVCPKPTNIEVSDLTQTSAKFTWSKGEYVESFVIKNGQDGQEILVSDLTYTATDLNASTPYVFYIKSDCDVIGESYWQEIPFITLEHVKPSVITIDASDITYSYAKLNGAITLGTMLIKEKGFEYKKTSDPITSFVKTKYIGEDDKMVKMITNLTENTSYTFRAYVSTDNEIIYGDTIRFYTKLKADAIPPILTTTPAISVTYNSATIGATITKRQEDILSQGIEYKKVTDATYQIAQSITQDNTLTANLLELLPNTKYVYRAFAKTYHNTYTSDDAEFTTLTYLSPELSADSVYRVTDKSAILYGTVIAKTEPILTKGFEWKSQTEDNNSWRDVPIISETMNATIDNLSSNTSYHFRVYATTQGKGKETSPAKPFTTLVGLNSVDNAVSVSLYPNPATTEVTLVVEGISKQAKVVVTDIQGRIINTLIVKPNNNRVDARLNVEGYAKGIYNVRITSENNSRTQKLIIK